MNWNKKNISVVLTAALISLLFYGCAAKNGVSAYRRSVIPVKNTLRSMGGMERAYKSDKSYLSFEDGGEPETNGDGSASRETLRADALRRGIVKLRGVCDSVVFINGASAIIGIAIEENPDGKTAKTIKKRVAEYVKDSDPAINHVAVTTSPELYKRISSISSSKALDHHFQKFS